MILPVDRREIAEAVEALLLLESAQYGRKVRRRDDERRLFRLRVKRRFGEDLDELCQPLLGKIPRPHRASPPARFASSGC